MQLHSNLVTLKTLFLSGAISTLGACAETVYTFQDFHDDGTSSNSQIYKMTGIGGNITNLTNNAHSNGSADVRHDGTKIAFRSIRGGANGHIYTMDMNGANQTVVPNTLSAGAPKWSRLIGTNTLFFTNHIHTTNEAIWRIKTDGTDKAQVTFPNPGEDDEYATDLDGKFIVYQRHYSANQDRDLFAKYVWDNRPEVQLTNTPNISESLPVASHNGHMIAYRAFHGGGVNDQIIVAHFQPGVGLTTLHTINPAMPVNTNISGIDFAANDAGLYFSAQADDSNLNPINRRQELFFINFDGAGQVRLSTNTDSDTSPSTVP